MDRELEEQIDELIHKATKDLKTRIVRIVVRHQTKLLKEQARELKASGTAPRKVVAGRGKTSSEGRGKSSAKKDSKYHSDSDSDGYYSD